MTVMDLGEVVRDGYVTEDFMLRVDSSIMDLIEPTSELVDCNYYSMMFDRIEYVRVTVVGLPTWLTFLFDEFEWTFRNYSNRLLALDEVDWLREGF